MKSALDDILRVKEFHENSAEIEITRRKFQLETAARAAREARKACDDHRAWRIRREQELYDTVIQKPVNRTDIENVRANIVVLRETEDGLEREAAEAEAARVAAVEALEQARAARILAARESDKIRKLVDQERVALAKEAERREERELEDFRSRSTTEQQEQFADG